MWVSIFVAERKKKVLGKKAAIHPWYEGGALRLLGQEKKNQQSGVADSHDTSRNKEMQEKPRVYEWPRLTKETHQRLGIFNATPDGQLHVEGPCTVEGGGVGHS